MNAATIWLCGWALGLLAIHKAATRIWNNPERHRQLVLLRSAANQPAGILAFAISAFMFWWVFVLAIPWDVWCDRHGSPRRAVTTMPDNAPSTDQIHAYLLANGWQMGESGSAAYLIVRMGHTVRMLHEPTEYDLDKSVFDISLAEGRHPADVRKDILACTVAPPDMPAAGDVIATLTARRIELGLSQRRVGFLSGLGTSVCEYEAGRHAPTLPKLIAWADSVDCDVTVTPRSKAGRQ